MKLKDSMEKVLKKAGVAFRFIPLPESLPPDIASHANFHGIKMDQAMATILYRTEKGIIGAVKRADTQIDEKKLKRVVGVDQLTYATKDDLDVLGVESGLVPYVGLDVPFFVDKKVFEVKEVYGTGGEKLFGMAMNSKDMVKTNRATIGDYTNFEKSREMLKKGRHRLLSGITPSGDGSLHIGNYLGAVKQFIELSKDHECFLMVADLHALTTIQNREQLKKNTETLILNELSLLMGELGESLPNVTFFRQSDVPMHTELQSILNNVTPLGFLKRAHAYKDKLAGDAMEDEINVGLFSYPMLMAADILIYKADLVPVGKDQKQHIEITRDIAQRFNKTYKTNTFKLPEPHIPEDIAVIMGTDGKRKMSKSLGNLISIFENEDVIKKQVMGTFTDPSRIHANDPGHIEGNIVFHYLDFFGEKSKVDELKKAYTEGKVSDVEVKNYLYECLLKTFHPARKVYEELRENPDKVKKILSEGAAKTRAVAGQTMKEVRDAIGLTNRYSLSGATGYLTIDEFSKVEMRVGKVVAAENLDGSDKLIKLTVDFGIKLRGDTGDQGEHEVRTILTGVRPFGYIPQDFSGKQFFFVTNLEPRHLRGAVSQGMILAVDLPAQTGGPDKPLFLSAEGMPLGARIR